MIKGCFALVKYHEIPAVDQTQTQVFDWWGQCLRVCSSSHKKALEKIRKVMESLSLRICIADVAELALQSVRCLWHGTSNLLLAWIHSEAGSAKQKHVLREFLQNQPQWTLRGSRKRQEMALRLRHETTEDSGIKTDEVPQTRLLSLLLFLPGLKSLL